MQESKSISSERPRMLLNADEVAVLTGWSRATVYRFIQTGILPVIRVGRTVRVPADALERWIRSQITGGIA